MKRQNGKSCGFYLVPMPEREGNWQRVVMMEKTRADKAGLVQVGEFQDKEKRCQNSLGQL